MTHRLLTTLLSALSLLSAHATVTATWTPVARHWSRSDVMDTAATTDTTVTCWRGEHIGLQALIRTTDTITEATLHITPPIKHAVATASWMRYVITTSWRECGYPDPTLPTYTVPDLIDHPGNNTTLLPDSLQPLWVSIDIPQTCAPGTYTGTLTVKSKCKHPIATLRYSVRIQSHSLPPSSQYAFYSDYWQQPYAISRYYGLTPWSKEHFEAMKPYARMLAAIGQKPVTAILFYEPWGEQSHDKFEPMVQTILEPDSTWTYDYTTLDAYVRFMQSHGIDGPVECFTMVPWQLRFRYLDRSSGQYRFLEAPTHSEAYEALWTPFLRSLQAHADSVGYGHRLTIVMDERGLPDMLNARHVAQKAVPGIKMSLAGSYHPELVDSLSLYALVKGDMFTPDDLHRRTDRNLTTLMYTCCATPAPSLFSNSDPADGAYLMLYATATGHQGYLHWSFNNWPEAPLHDTRFRMFAPGDTYLVYPDGLPSIRYEQIRRGIQLSEKARLLRQEFTHRADITSLQKLTQATMSLSTGITNPWYPTSAIVDGYTHTIDQLSEL